MLKNNAKMVWQKMADQKQKFGIRKLSVGVASVLLGTVFYMQGGTVHADVNPTVSTDANTIADTGNSSINMFSENFGTGNSTVASSTSDGVSSANSTSPVGSASDAANSITTSQPSTSPTESITSQVDKEPSAVSNQGNGVSTSQVNEDADKAVKDKNTNADFSSVQVQNSQTSNSNGNTGNRQLFPNLSLFVNQNSNANISSLLASKVSSTDASNNATNGGFDQNTWGLLIKR